MKKFVLFTAFIFSVTLGMAQMGSNGFHHGNGHHGGNMGINSGAAHAPPTMSPVEFNRARQAISRQRFENDRLRVAKQITRRNLMRSVQVQKLTRLFNFESTRLKYAKFAYEFVADPDRYYLVNESFRFSSSVRDLDAYIAGLGAYGQPVAGPIGNSTTTIVHGQHGSTTYSGGITVTSGHGGQGHGINHGAPVQTGSACGPAPAPAPAPLQHMCPIRFGEALNHIEKQCFDSDKLRVARQALRGQLLSTDMVMQVMNAMTFDSYKLDFAKWAYLNTVDPGRYYLVSDAFTFSSSARELDHYIRSIG
jgi:hypothetical protein